MRNNGMKLITRSDFERACYQFSEHIQSVKILKGVRNNGQKEAGSVLIACQLSKSLSKGDGELLLADLRSYLADGIYGLMPAEKLEICLAKNIQIHMRIWIRECPNEKTMNALYEGLGTFTAEHFRLKGGKAQFQQFFAMKGEGIKVLASEICACYELEGEMVEVDLGQLLPDPIAYYELASFAVVCEKETIFEAKNDSENGKKLSYHKQYHTPICALEYEITKLLADEAESCKLVQKADYLQISVIPKGQSLSDSEKKDMEKYLTQQLPVGIFPKVVLAKKVEALVDVSVLSYAYYEDSKKRIQELIEQFMRERAYKIGALISLQELYDAILTLPSVSHIVSLSFELGSAQQDMMLGGDIKLAEDAHLSLKGTKIVVLPEEV